MARIPAHEGANMDERLTVRMDAERRELLEQYARREGMAASLIVRHLVYRFLEQQERVRAFPRLGGTS